jgi:hypothetical protein
VSRRRPLTSNERFFSAAQRMITGSDAGRALNASPVLHSSWVSDELSDSEESLEFFRDRFPPDVGTVAETTFTSVLTFQHIDDSQDVDVNGIVQDEDTDYAMDEDGWVQFVSGVAIAGDMIGVRYAYANDMTPEYVDSTPAPPVFRGYTTYDTITSSGSVTAPVARVIGDTLLTFIDATIGPVTSVSSGWSLVGQSYYLGSAYPTNQVGIYQRVATGDSGDNFGFTTSGTNFSNAIMGAWAPCTVQTFDLARTGNFLSEISPISTQAYAVAYQCRVLFVVTQITTWIVGNTHGTAWGTPTPVDEAYSSATRSSIRVGAYEMTGPGDVPQFSIDALDTGRFNGWQSWIVVLRGSV